MRLRRPTSRLPEGARTIAPVRPGSTDEAEFVVAMADAINHASATVAAEPDARFPPGSLAATIQDAYGRTDALDRAGAADRARRRLGGSREERHLAFGGYGERGADHWQRAERGLPVELKEPLRRAVRSRLTSMHADLQHGMSVIAATDTTVFTELPQTWVEVGYFTGDIIWAEKKVEIQTPTRLDFRWRTEEPDAERGVWQLYLRTKAGNELLLDTGPAGDAPGQVFSIEMSTYLPSTPPAKPVTYLVRVTPGTKPSLVVSPDQSRGPGKKAGKAVGPASDPVTIVYTSHVDAPAFGFVECYERLRFEIGAIEMIEDQVGPGAEEFHVCTMLTEVFPRQSGIDALHQKWGPSYAVLDPDGPRVADLWGHADLNIGGPPTEPTWPRAFIVLMSVMEQDGGGSEGVQAWKEQVWNVANLMLGADVEDIVSDYLQEAFENYLDDIDAVLQAGGQAAQWLSGQIGGMVGAIGGMVTAAVMLVAAALIGGAADDYYGTEVYVKVLLTNAVDHVVSLPGSLDGGDYVLAPEILHFSGATSYPEAAASDGHVHIDLNWRFSKRELY